MKQEMYIKTCNLPIKTIGYRPFTDTNPHVLIVRKHPPIKFNQTPVKIPNRIPNLSIAHVDGNVKIAQTTINTSESQLTAE
jgi:hypothetical protein